MSMLKQDAESKAHRYFKQGDWRLAIAVVNTALDDEPEHAGLWLLKAIILHSRGDWSASLAAAETAMTLTPLPIGVQLVLADGYVHTGRPELALLAYQHLMTLGPLPNDLYAGLYAGFRNCGRQDLALTVCRAAVEADQENHAAYFGMAHCMALLGYSAAYIASVLRTAVGLEPGSQVYRTSLAIQLVRDGRPSEEHAELRRVDTGHLDSIECCCSARKLLQLCEWAGDAERADALGRVVERLSGGNKGNKQESNDV